MFHKNDDTQLLSFVVSTRGDFLQRWLETSELY